MVGPAGGDRGQAFTLEGFAAGLVLLASLLFALQVTAVTPLTASTSSQHIENQLDATASGVLAGGAENETLRETLLYWNSSRPGHWGADYQGTYSLGGPPTAFGETLNRTFLERGIAFDLNVYYVSNGRRHRHQIVDFGEPSDNAVSATRTVALYDDSELLAADGTPTGTTLAATDDFYVGDDRSPDSGLYALVQVEVVAWRM